MKIINIYGPAGVGKTSLAQQILAENEKAIEISTGAIVRACFEEDDSDPRIISSYGDILKEHMDKYTSGDYIPDEVMIPIIFREIEYWRSQGKDTICLAGSIKTIPQARVLDETHRAQYSEYSLYNIGLDAPDEILIERMTSRALEDQRPDNGSLRARVDGFRTTGQPLFDYYQDRENSIYIQTSHNGIPEVRDITLELCDISREDTESNLNNP